jgi:hypothetical protein
MGRSCLHREVEDGGEYWDVVSIAFDRKVSNSRQWVGIGGKDDDLCDSTVKCLCAFVGTLCTRLEIISCASFGNVLFTAKC